MSRKIQSRLAELSPTHLGPWVSGLVKKKHRDLDIGRDSTRGPN